MAALAVPLVMADLTRHVMMDANVGPPLPMYQTNCTHTHLWQNVECLSVYGWLLTIGCTWIGYACLMAGVIWATGLLQRVTRTWRRLRGQPEPINCTSSC